jgi:hypothetical protein
VATRVHHEPPAAPPTSASQLSDGALVAAGPEGLHRASVFLGDGSSALSPRPERPYDVRDATIDWARDAGRGRGGRGARLGLGGALLLLLLSIIFRRDFISLFSGPGGPPPEQNEASRTVVETPAEANLVQFVSFVLDDAQKTWDGLLPQQTGKPYRHAKLVLFRDVTESSCGRAQSATGPFYCPADENVYIDLGFYDELKSRFGAPGEFAQAYVLAHEIGHHVQKILGISDEVRALQASRPSQANPLSVRLELQADCLAGIWAHSTAQRNLIEPE